MRRQPLKLSIAKLIIKVGPNARNVNQDCPWLITNAGPTPPTMSPANKKYALDLFEPLEILKTAAG